MKRLLHRLYKLFGSAFCKSLLPFWKLRDRIFRFKGSAILFVAHPDDDALFFHTYIKENHPYVVMLFTGWSIRRLFDFFKMMRYYGVRCRAYATVSGRAYYDDHRRKLTEMYVEDCMKTGEYSTVITHNASGEYGHSTHRLVHETIVKLCHVKNVEILCPVDVSEIERFPLDQALLTEKRFIFENIYKSEAWVMTEKESGVPVWFRHEQLERSRE